MTDRPADRLDALTAGRRPYLLLTLFCAVLFLAGLGDLPPLDRDEARFAQATAQMLESGDYVDIRFQATPRHKKPAGIHWLQAASVTLFSSPQAREIWAYRLPSVLGAWLAVLLTFQLGAALFGRRAGFVGAAMLAASVLLILEAHQAKTDAALLAATVAAQLVLARLYTAERGGGPAPGAALTAGFWIAQGVGVMLKGPIAPLVSLLTMTALSAADRDWRWLKRLGWLWGLPLAAVIAAPWFVLISQHAPAGGDGFVTTAVTRDLIPKLLGGQESHGAPPGYYTLLMMAFFWPGSLLAWPALARAWRGRAEPAVRFCLFWLLPGWLLFEAVPTKLPHYVLPMYPALALLTGWAAVRVIDGAADWFDRRLLLPVAALWAVVTLALGGAAFYLPLRFGQAYHWTGLIYPLIALLLVLGAAIHIRRRNGAELVRHSTLWGGVLTALILGVMLPGFRAMWAGRDAAAAVAAHVAAGDQRQGAGRPPVAVAGFGEPSMVFLLGTATHLTNGGGAAADLLADRARAAIVEGRQLAAFTAALDGRDGAVRELTAVSGINYSKGKKIRLHVFVRR